MEWNPVELNCIEFLKMPVQLESNSISFKNALAAPNHLIRRQPKRPIVRNMNAKLKKHNNNKVIGVPCHVEGIFHKEAECNVLLALRLFVTIFFQFRTDSTD